MKKKINRGSMQIFYDMAHSLMKSEMTTKDIFAIYAWKERAKKPAFIYEKDGKSIYVKYPEFIKLVKRNAKYLDETLKDIEKNSFVALKLPNSIEWPIIFWSLLMSGYKPLLINSILNKEDTEKLLCDGGASAIITNEETNYSIPMFKATLSENKDETYEPRWANEVAFCTSGTTGDSRIFVYDGKALTYQLISAYDMPKTTNDIMYVGNIRLIALLPFAHIFGFVAVLLWYLYFGMTIVIPSNLNPNVLIPMIKKYKCTHIYAVPLFWNLVANKFNKAKEKLSIKEQNIVNNMMKYNNDEITSFEAGIAKYNFVQNKIKKQVLGPQIVYCISGGGALSKEVLKTINGLGYNLYNGFGMTEIGVTSVELSFDVNQRNKGTVGKPLYEVEYKIEDNELLVKSNYIHKYRLKDGKKIESDIDENGYFHTGDIASEDEEGYYYIKGKNKNVIISSNGENVYPEEIESKLSNLPYVSNLTIIPNEKEEVTLILCLEKNLNDQEKEELENSIKNVNDSLPLSMQIKESYISKNPLPLNGSMKIKKYLVVDDFKNNKDNYIKLKNGITTCFKEYEEEDVKEVLEKIINVISKELDIERSNITPNSNLNNDLGADSFTYMAIIGDVENEFNIQIDSNLIGALNTPNEIAKAVLDKKTNH